MEMVTSKRQILSEMSRTLDPLGILLSVITQAKILFQATWRTTQERVPARKSGSRLEALGWDETLPDGILLKWNSWSEELPLLEQISIPRCFRTADLPLKDSQFELHLFSDASSDAFGAVAYLRTIAKGNIHLSFVLSIGRLAPLKLLSIPRFELQGAVTAVRLAKTIKSELRLPITEYYFRTDSEIVLRWINSSPCNYSSSVSHRVGEILRLSEPEQWRFISGSKNPADDCTRGMPPPQARIFISNKVNWASISEGTFVSRNRKGRATTNRN
jgi:hypothetical protein